MGSGKAQNFSTGRGKATFTSTGRGYAVFLRGKKLAYRDRNGKAIDSATLAKIDSGPAISTTAVRKGAAMSINPASGRASKAKLTPIKGKAKPARKGALDKYEQRMDRLG